MLIRQKTYWRIGLVLYLLFLFNLGKTQELYKVKPLPCNTPDRNEFSAIPFEKGLMFCSDRPDFSPLKFETTKGAKPLVNVFVVPNDSSTDVKEAVAFSSVYAHDGPVAFYDNGNKAVITRTLNDKTKLKSLYKDTKLGLFFYAKEKGKWRETGAFTFNDHSYSCGQATINNQGTVLIFSSDMPGSIGGTDLYYSTFNEEDSVWILPVNLGQVINSSKNEMFPFLHPSGILYFSSAGKKGKGGLDVFHTVGGYPYARIVHEVDEINSDKDDFGFWASEDYSKGYLTSNRGGTDDIYAVELSYPNFTNCDNYENVDYCYEFFEEASINVDTIPMVYEWDFGDGIRKKGLSAYHCYKEPGTYTVQLNVFDTVINTLFMNEATYTLEIQDINQPLMIVPDSVNPQKPFWVSSGQARFNEFVIAEYYWDFGDGMQMKGERFQTTIEQPGVYEVMLGVTSAPDQNGRSKMRCFKKKLVVTNDTIPPQLVDDSSDPANEKLPGGTQGTTYVLVEDSEGFHVTRMKGDGTSNAEINHLPNTIYYLKLNEKGDTIAKKHVTDPDSRKLLENYLEQAEAPYEVKKNGLVTYNAFLPSDSLKYPVYGLDIKKFYGTIDSMAKAPWDFTLLPKNIANALLEMQTDEAGILFAKKNDKRYLPQYNTTVSTPNDSTTVFYKQTTGNSNNGNITNTTQYDTRPFDGTQNNGNTNNVNNTGNTTAQNNSGNTTNQNGNNTNTTNNNNNTTQNNTTNQNGNTTNNTNTAQNNSGDTTNQNGNNTNTTNNNNTTQNNTTNQNGNTTNNTNNNTTSNPPDTSVVALAELKGFSHPDLEYKVQIGAYRYPKNFKYQYLRKLGKMDEQIKLEDDITRITLGRFNTLQEAYDFKDVVKREGIDDAFVTAVFKGKRYYLSELKVLLKDLVPTKSTNTM